MAHWNHDILQLLQYHRILHHPLFNYSWSKRNPSGIIIHQKLCSGVSLNLFSDQVIGSWLWTAIQRQMQRQQMLIEDNVGLREYLQSVYDNEQLHYSSAAAWRKFFFQFSCTYGTYSAVHLQYIRYRLIATHFSVITPGWIEAVQMFQFYLAWWMSWVGHGRARIFGGFCRRPTSRYSPRPRSDWLWPSLVLMRHFG